MNPTHRLFLDNIGLVWWSIRRYRGLGLDEEELFQETALVFFTNAEKFDGEHLSQFIRWQVLRALSRLVRQRRKFPALIQSEIADGVPDREQQQPDAELPARIRDALRRLHREDAAVVAERFGLNGEPCSLHDIASRRGVSITRIAQRIARARRRLAGPLAAFAMRGGHACEP